jgi:proline dehydrogenase
MFRSFLIYLSKATWARQLVTRWQFAWRAASRFIAGETLDDAIRTIQALNARGINATLDHLGEHTTTPDESRRAVQDILRAIDAIQEAGVRANVSIKLTQIGLQLGEELCAENLRTILQYAGAKGNFVRIDMEDSPWVDVTLGLYHAMADCGLGNTGVVIQAYLYRSEQDVRGLAAQSGRIRLCKGAYKEPANVAYPKKADVDANYDRLAQIMLDASLAVGAAELSPDGLFPPPPAFATHDPRRISNAKAYAQKIGLKKTAIEFQMLYGIRRDLQEQTAQEGYPVRVYVPYGTEWYPYYMRRLAERPANVWFFISNFFRK